MMTFDFTGADEAYADFVITFDWVLPVSGIALQIRVCQ